ncbi:phosphoglycerate kinase [Lentibacter algarum]|uniref:phosphoglycerate kinase n=1 Tax=Lentibacter algarum TaxID=576131 RepID=UPI001C0805C6|nr:phosphoglycerate kinase [Lentibacter algarum]
MAWKKLDDLDMAGKRVLTRVDINVPVHNGVVTDDTRIQRITPTINAILAKGGKPILLAHFGRPKGKTVLDMSLRVTLHALEAALGRTVAFVETLEGAEPFTQEALNADVILIENIRYHPGEEANDAAFVKRLAGLGDIYCNDAFSVAHRAHASTAGIAALLPSCAGRLMQAELQALESALSSPKRPVGAVVGGAKVSSKLDLLSNLVEKLDTLIIGGGMANTFLMAMGAKLGASLVEAEMLDTAREILIKAETKGCRVILPTDGLVSRAFKAGADFEVIKLNENTTLDADQMVLDAGPEAIKTITAEISKLNTLIWNGPLGAFEIAPFDTATMAAAKIAAAQTLAGDLITVAGGGDTVAALNQAGAADDFSYISTAGGAFLEWMEGKTLPGVAALG